MQAQDVGLLGHDTTLLEYGPPQPPAGLGPVQVKQRAEYLRHPTVAVPPARVPCGVFGATGWQRPEPPVAQARTRQPSEEKESERGFEGETLACEVQPACATPLVVHGADRAGAIHAGCVDARRRPAEARAAWLIRATDHRRLAKGQEHRDVWTARREAPPRRRLTFAVARPPARPPRQRTVTGTATQGMLQQARRPGGPRPSGAGAAVSAQEVAPPQGAEAGAWLRLTRLPVGDCARACPVGPWSRGRWERALCCRGLTQGAQLEQ
jgi:hypothetical protein